MGRVWKQWTDEKVESAPVAPHRYLWSGALGPDGTPVPMELWEAKTYEEAKRCFSYAEGEVIYLESDGVAVKAKIAHVMFSYRNAFGERAEAYKVVRATAKGLWSKNWEVVHPGFIQRGYQRAGLAPDVDEHQPLKQEKAEA